MQQEFRRDPDLPLGLQPIVGTVSDDPAHGEDEGRQGCVWG